MSFHDGPANRKAYAHAFCLRRVERMKDVLAYFRRKPWPIVLDGHFDFVVFDSLDGNGQALCALALHGFDGIADEVHQDLLNLDTVDEDINWLLG